MKVVKDEHFWPSYVDLLTSLFFIVFVLFIVSYVLYTKNLNEAEIRAGEADRLKEIRKTLETLMSDREFFVYEEQYKRYRLAQDIVFNTGEFEITPYTVANYAETHSSLNKIGTRLKHIIENLQSKKNIDPGFNNVSYLLIIAGRASKDNYANNYELSYRRALSLYQYWKKNLNVDFDAPTYQDIIDLQISGNGVGGLGRDSYVEKNNQCFLIQIIPKITGS